MSDATLVAPHIELRPTISGVQPFIAGKGFKVRVLVELHREGWSPEELATQYDLTFAEVHAALAYYFDHQLEIDGLIAAGEQMVTEMGERRSDASSPDEA